MFVSYAILYPTLFLRKRAPYVDSSGESAFLCKKMGKKSTGVGRGSLSAQRHHLIYPTLSLENGPRMWIHRASPCFSCKKIVKKEHWGVGEGLFWLKRIT